MNYCDVIQIGLHINKFYKKFNRKMPWYDLGEIDKNEPVLPIRRWMLKDWML